MCTDLSLNKLFGLIQARLFLVFSLGKGGWGGGDGNGGGGGFSIKPRFIALDTLHELGFSFVCN